MSAFDRLAAKLAGKPGVNDPRGLAAAIGRRKFGAQTFNTAAARGVSARTVQREQRSK